MVINGIIVTNMTQNSPKFIGQVQEFLDKSKLLSSLSLVEVKNQNCLNYIEYHEVDFVLFWDKDLYLASVLSNKGYKVFNRPEAIRLCDDKALTSAALLRAKVPQPAFYVIPLHYYGNVYDYYDLYKENILALGFPVVIKERSGSFGEQVYLAKNEEELVTIIKKHGDKGLITQAFNQKYSGTDYRINVVGGKVISAVKRVNNNDFRSNINQGGEANSFVPSLKMKRLAIKATKAINGHFAGVDLMINDDDEPVVIEVNSNMRTVAVNIVSENDLTLAILNYIMKNI